MNNNLYLKHIIDTAIKYDIELHSVVIYDDYISLTTRTGTGMRVERVKPNNPIADDEIRAAIEYIMDCASVSVAD